LDEAIRRRGPTRGLLHHSDRGCQYTSQDYRANLAALGRDWSSRVELRAAVFEYIEIFYNRQRLHSTLDYKTPDQLEKEHAAQFAA
jgi:putative transposase